MADGMDAEGIVGFFREADAVVTDAEAQFVGLSLKLFDVAVASLGEAKERGEDAHGGVRSRRRISARARSDQAIFFTPSLSAP
jgi:hypothetical protein